MMRQRVVAFLLASLLALAASPAFAQEAGATADEADVEFRLGNQAYSNRDYREALSHYFASNRLAPNRNVTFNIARCYENLGMFVEAWRYFRTYQKGSKDDDERQKVGEALDRIGQKLGVLKVESEPPGARIYLNRVDLGSYGNTPGDVPVEPGTYEIIVEADGYESAKVSDVEVKAGDVITRKLELKRRLGQLKLSGGPSNVSFTVGDAAPVDITIPSTIDVPVGRQSVTFSADGYEPLTLTVDVVEKASSALEVSLEKKTGALVITATELDAAVYLDGEVIGFTPVVIDDVPVGRHRVVVRQDGFQAFEQVVDIETDVRIEVDAPLVATSEVAAASRVRESVSDAPASVSLISSREIETFAYRGTADALQGTRGIYYTDDLTYRLVGLRGYGSFGLFGNRTLVQLDGHTLNDSWLEASFHEFEVMTDIYGLDRIELVRGPNSVLYGSGAFQGVINLASPEIDDEFQSNRVGVGVVGDGAGRAYGHVRQAFDGGGIQLSAGVSERQPRDFFSPARNAVAENVGQWDEYTLRANAAWGDFKFYSYWHDRTQNSPLGAYETIFGDDGSFERDRRGFADLRWEPRWEAFELDTRVFYDGYLYDGLFVYEEADGGGVNDEFVGHGVGTEVRALFRPFEGARWTVGIEGVRNLVHDAESFDNEGVYFSAKTPFWKASGHAIARQDFFNGRFGIWAGARYDIWSFDALPTEDGDEEARTISNINPRVVLLAKPYADGTSKVMFGRGFRAPSVYELTYNDDGFTQVAAPQLEPETTYSVELEHTHSLPERFELVGAAFLNQIDNRIEQTGGGNETDPIQFQNIDSQLYTVGGEIELRRPFFRGWMFTAMYGYQRTADGSIGDVFDGPTVIPNSPNHLASIKVAVPIVRRRLILANRARFESGRVTREGSKTRPSLLWDVVASGEVDVVPVRYAVRVENVLDWNYAHPVGDEFLDIATPQAGRTFLVDLAVEF